MTRHGPSLSRLSSGWIHRPHRYYARAKTPLCPPDALRRLRASVPSARPFLRVSCIAPASKDQYRPGCLRALSRWPPLPVILRWSSSGLPGSWGVLSCLCPALRPRSRLTTMPSRQLGVAPARQTTKAATITFSRLIHTASALAVYASSFGFPYTGKTRFRRVANPYRVGFEPTGLLRRISSRLRQPIYSNAPGFAWRHCQ